MPPDQHPYLNTWGKLNAGQRFGIIAFDIDRALARAGLTKVEATLVQAIRERGWGKTTRKKSRQEAWPESEPCELSLITLARELTSATVESVRIQLSKAKTRLINDHLILEQENGLLINKQVHEWKRLSPDDIAYAASAQTRVLSDTDTVSNLTRHRVLSDTAPYKERTRVLDLETSIDCVRGETPRTQSLISPEEDLDALFGPEPQSPPKGAR